jgi:hypothetical protein
MKKVLGFAAVAEAATGLALIVLPSLVVRLLFGVELTDVSLSIARVTGMALLGLGIACWPGCTPLCGMLTYSALADAVSRLHCRSRRMGRYSPLAGSRVARNPDGISGSGIFRSTKNYRDEAVEEKQRWAS